MRDDHEMGMSGHWLCSLWRSPSSSLAAGGGARAETVADFYKGKTVSLIAGFPPGGGYDTYVRVLARHYGRFLPGQPTVVASNMPGAGSLTAANNIYAKYAPDGLALAMFASSAAMEPLIGNKAALFDATEVQLDRLDVAGRGLLRRLAASRRRHDLRRDADQGNHHRRRRAGRHHLSAPDGAEEHAEGQLQGHPGLQGHARHQHRHAARRGERHLRHVRLLGEGAVRRRGEGRDA